MSERDIAKDPQPGDVSHQTFSDGWGAQTGKHTYTVKGRTPRTVYVQHVWPDGITTHIRYWLSEWRRLVRLKE